ncbi:MAG: peptide-methionine (S)-S-oxide reductase MsrA [Acidimicrobiia bacterium]|nr:peptide-methionine (S)-S-oxide reductase MsrA [Acidimicrobiia bacterium]
MFGRSKNRDALIAPDDALPGRSEPIDDLSPHFVTGRPITPPFPEGHEVISFGMGCFWGTEKFFWKLDGVWTTAVGYQGGYTPNPTYEEVCSGRTGHAEVALVVYDPDVTALDDLFKEFWENHDPTTLNRQGNDIGTQYRSAIYTTTEDQAEAARKSLAMYQEQLREAGFGGITTEIREAGPFFYAEDYHQQYLAKNPNGYCNHGFCQAPYPRS